MGSGDDHLEVDTGERMGALAHYGPPSEAPPPSCSGTATARVLVVRTAGEMGAAL